MYMKSFRMVSLLIWWDICTYGNWVVLRVEEETSGVFPKGLLIDRL